MKRCINIDALRGRVVPMVIALAAAVSAVRVGAVELKVQPELERCANTSMSVGGLIGRYTDAVVTNWLLRAPRENPAILEMFDVRDEKPYRDLLPWSGEFAGKHLTGATQVLRLTGDEKLRAATAKFVHELIARQADDGYLGPFPKEHRLTGQAPNVGGGGPTWDLWGHYHAMLGLLLWYDDTQDAEALEAARRIGDLLCEKFPEGGTPVSATGSFEMNQAVVHSAALLYQRTGEQKYLDLAERVVEDFAAPGAGDYLRMGLKNVEFFQIPRPRWESLHPIMGLAELYWTTGNEDYRTAFENLWWSIVKLDRHNNGGFSSGEQAHGNPYHQGAIETCCTIAWMAMSVEMLRMTGDSIVADELEMSTLNQVVGLQAPSGEWSTYNTPMNGARVPSIIDIAFQKRPGSEELNCCSVNAARGFGMISDWAVMCDDAGLTLNWYGPSTFKTEVGDTKVTLTQKTTYPVEGRIELTVDPAESHTFELKLRVPHWSKQTTVEVNGERLAPKAGEYLAVNRTWSPGDKVVITLDMSLRYWAGERECEGQASIYRGPLLLAYEHATTAPKFDGKWEAHGFARSSKDPQAGVTFEFEGDAVEWRGGYFDDAGQARVVIDGKEVEVVDQYGPERGKPFVWKKEGLGPGKHTIRLEAMGEKREESSDIWLNVAELKATENLPRFDAGKLPAKVAATAAPDGMLTVTLPDAAGKATPLRDFGSAGQEGRIYQSWLPATGIAPVAFSKENPSRTAHGAQ